MKNLYRYIFLFLAISLSIATAAAQNMSVSSFRLDESDLTANLQGTMVLDQNGEKCALIKIRTTQSGFSFDVGSLGVMRVDYKTAEVWIYVPFGVRRMTIQHPQLGTVQYDFPLTIEKARTYVMELVTAEVITTVKQAVTSQYVLFELSPSNTTVELDGQTLETTDGTATARKPFGRYMYRAYAPRYATEEGYVMVSDPTNKHIVGINLQPQFKTFNFIAPKNSDIYINDAKIGAGTCSIELAFGTYLIETRLEKHRSSFVELTLGQDSSIEQHLPSPSPIAGSLDINSAPANAEIWVDNELIGTTPMYIDQQLIGQYNIVIKKKGYKNVSQLVTVEEGQISSLSFRLGHNKKTVVSSKPIETANCYIVSDPGVFKFKAVKGNSSELVGKVASVEVLWESYGTAEAPAPRSIVKNVMYADGVISVEASDARGNALIAAKDDSGTILWSWHLWFTDKPEDLTFGEEGIAVMDRNLGATNTKAGKSERMGLLYQWGRKDPFLSGIYGSEDQLSASSAGMWPNAVASDSETGTLDYARKHPMTFITDFPETGDWLYSTSASEDNPLWASNKTIYDPCPVGYRVPDGGEDSVWASKQISSVLWSYSLCGYLYGGSGMLNVVGIYGSYWSVTTSEQNAYNLYFNIYGEYNPASTETRASALSIRCCRE